MKRLRTCPEPLGELDRRRFLKRTVLGAAGGVAFASREEQILHAAQTSPAEAPPAVASVPMGRIRDVRISRLICGGNLISGYAHARDLIYMSRFLKEYFTDERILKTWEICEQHGINTMIVNPSDQRAVRLYRQYRREGRGQLQWLAQVSPEPEAIETTVRQAVEDGAVGVFLVGNLGDRWSFDQRVDLIGRFLETVKQTGVISGVAGHSLEMLQTVTGAGLDPDFFMKTLHHTRYWSARQPGQNKPVIENYAIDNYYDLEPEKTIEFMARCGKPWIAYKVLAAGAIHPSDGFDYAFRHGADFICVGMFDFQVAEDVALVNRILPRHAQRSRPWCA
ncbi:MAG: twin-arginine translocation signal domain-containing protein [Verrucomicrobia bacterium]|nr:MAG: twin-arginine translocation signal domain-containing protein [Verrucomicrobiota bacterium]